jgi:hypothetical protein
MSFFSGLQFFSVPYAYTGVNLDTLFGYSNVKLAAWSPATSQYALTPTAPAGQIESGQGYWADFPQDVTLTSIGTPTDTTQDFQIPLTTGWNMIGDPFTATIPLASLTFNTSTFGRSQSETFAQATSGLHPLIGGTVWGYSPLTNSYIQASALVPGQGYWIKAYADTTMTVPHP